MSISNSSGALHDASFRVQSQGQRQLQGELRAVFADAGTHLGATLVFPLPSGGGRAGSMAELLRQRIAAFRARVDRDLPGMYCWLSDASLHVTLRALMG